MVTWKTLFIVGKSGVIRTNVILIKYGSWTVLCMAPGKVLGDGRSILKAPSLSSISNPHQVIQRCTCQIMIEECFSFTYTSMTPWSWAIQQLYWRRFRSILIQSIQSNGPLNHLCILEYKSITIKLAEDWVSHKHITSKVYLIDSRWLTAIRLKLLYRLAPSSHRDLMSKSKKLHISRINLSSDVSNGYPTQPGPISHMRYRSYQDSTQIGQPHTGY